MKPDIFYLILMALLVALNVPHIHDEIAPCRFTPWASTEILH